MKTHLKLAAAVALAACAATAAWAQGASDWKPSKPVRIIVPIVGSTNDVLARLIGPKLQEALGQPVWSRTNLVRGATSVHTR